MKKVGKTLSAEGMSRQRLWDAEAPHPFDTAARCGGMSQAAAEPKPDLEQKEVGLSGLIARVRKTPAVRTAAKVAKLGDQEPLYAMAALLTGAGVGLGRPELIRAGLRMTAAIGVADALKSLVKKGVARSRPNTVIEEDRYVLNSGAGDHGKAEQSFPSGHVACSLAAGLALSRVEPGIAPAVGLAVTGLSVTRVLEGAHWPSDVAAGLVIGLAADAITAAVFHQLEPALGLKGRRRGGLFAR